MDVSCRRCGEPWEAYYLRHDMSWHICDRCGLAVVPAAGGRWRVARYETTTVFCDHDHATRHIEAAHDGQIPEQVRAWYEAGQPGWLRFVATGRGCPHCHGRQPANPPALSWGELDDIDAATEGMAFSDWL